MIDDTKPTVFEFDPMPNAAAAAPTEIAAPKKRGRKPGSKNSGTPKERKKRGPRRNQPVEQVEAANLEVEHPTTIKAITRVAKVRQAIDLLGELDRADVEYIVGLFR